MLEVRYNIRSFLYISPCDLGLASEYIACSGVSGYGYVADVDDGNGQW